MNGRPCFACPRLCRVHIFNPMVIIANLFILIVRFWPLKGKTYQFDSKIVLELIQKQGKKQVKTDNNKNIAVSDDVLKIFQKQLETKDKQIEKLQNTVDYFQKENLALRLESSKQKKLIADKNDKLNAVSENDLKTEKKHWWQSLF